MRMIGDHPICGDCRYSFVRLTVYSWSPIALVIYVA